MWMWSFEKKKVPNKWEELVQQILNNKSLPVHKESTKNDTWFVFRYNDNEFRISSRYIFKFGNFYKFQVYSDELADHVCITDLFKEKVLRKIFNHALHCQNQLEKNQRIASAEKQIFGKESHESM